MRTSNQYNKARHTASRRGARDGITLLFVISMVVLFLLMGTTFVVVSNDYYKVARRRSLVASNVIDQEGLLDSAFFQLMREVPLHDSSSPLRGHSILADQYGYGLRATVDSATEGTGADMAFVDVVLSASPTGGDRISRIRVPGETVTLRSAADYFDGALNGQVFSLTSGSLAGVSERIVSHDLTQVVPGDPTMDTLTVRVPRGSVDWSVVAAGDQVIINGRDFSGVGSGDASDLEYDQYDLIDTTKFLGATAPVTSSSHPLNVNQIGVPQEPDPSRTPVAAENGRVFLNAQVSGGAFVDGSGFLALDASPNEAYDAPDFQNMFLSGLDSAGNIIPSFHRDSLYKYQASAFAVTPQNIRRYSFRPVFVESTTAIDNVAFGATASREFWDEYLDDFTGPDGTWAGGAVNASANLDVDSDGDGILDSVWIDIGLPTQTNANGDSFRPLVAYRVVDMDGKLNVNAHGSTVDEALREIRQQMIDDAGITEEIDVNRGSGHGVAEISLAGVVSDYEALLDARYEGDLRVPSPPTVREDRYGSSQKLFGYTLGLNADIFETPSGDATFFSSGANVLGQHLFQSSITIPDAMPGFLPLTTATPPMFEATTPVLLATDLENPYTTDFSLGGGSADNLFQPYELEPLLRRFDADSNLISGRLGGLIAPASFADVTTNSFDVAMPTVAVPLAQRLNAVLRRNGMTSQAAISTRIEELVPREIFLGGKLNLNRALGNGEDDDGDGVVDNEVPSAGESTAQRRGPTLSATYLTTARQQLAQDIYITILLACGDRELAGFSVTATTEDWTLLSGTGGEDRPAVVGPPAMPALPLTDADREYRKLIAQYAVNLVDFRDPDSIMTPFEFDIEPFDATGWDVDGNVTTTGEPDRVVVWGAERAELLLTESFASHDRQTQDTSMDASGEDTTGTDMDWDSVNAPISNAAFEIYNPWLSNAAGLPAELGNAAVDAIDLGKVSIAGNPVWRIGLKRERSELNTDIVRTIYFADDISGLPAAMDATGDRFFPSTSAGDVAPGAYVSVGGSAVIPFGTLSMTLTAPILIDTPRPLSISDVNGGYMNVDGTAVAPGVVFEEPAGTPQPRDVPVDSHAVHGDSDFAAIWTNGITDNFRYAYLQRLANPLAAFDPVDNPYITVDSISVDLVSRNSLSGDPDGHDATELVDPHPMADSSPDPTATPPTLFVPASTVAGPGAPIDGEYFVESTERGEIFLATSGLGVARQNLFGATDGEDDELKPAPAAYPTAISNSFGMLNDAYDDTAATPRTFFGSLTWNNRPYASTAEIMNVPYFGGGLLNYFFNSGATATASAPPNPSYVTYITEITPYFSDLSSGASVYQHLLRFAGPLGSGAAGDPTANRFAQLFEFVEVPSLYLGSETYLDEGGAGYPAGFSPPFNYIPNFRVPGRVNINTVNSAGVWTPLVGGPSSPVGYDSGTTMLSGTTPIRDIAEGPSDIAGYFTSSEGRMFVPNIAGATHLEPAKGSSGTIFQLDSAGTAAVFDAIATPGKDPTGTASFKNELRQRLSGMVTTKSSVFAIWITIGYFKVDEFGRVGAEVGVEENKVSRDRAFYMIDRSIPVAFEPGENHNIDQTVLLRTIIE